MSEGMSQRLLLSGWIRAHHRANEIERVLAAQPAGASRDDVLAAQVLELRRMAADFIDEAIRASPELTVPIDSENMAS